MIDLENAFDLVWHQGLLYKLKQLWLRGNVLKLVEDVLNNRTIQILVGAAMSSTYFLENGKRQGSVLSPLLFIVTINDLPESSCRVKPALLAEDNSMWTSGPNLQVLSRDVHRYITETAKFSEEWGFKILVNKTVVILLTRSMHIPTDVILKINDFTIKLEKTVQFPGVIFDQGLTWAAHIDSIIDRCKVRLNLMRAKAGATWVRSEASCSSSTRHSSDPLSTTEA